MGLPTASVDESAEISVELQAKPGTPRHDELLRRNLGRTAAWQRRQLRRVLADAGHLNRFGRRTYSQAGEDGVLAEILRRVEQTTGYFVELGSGDGSENCTRALLEAGWQGCWIEADRRFAVSAEAIAGSRAKVVRAMLSRENAVSLLDAAGVPAEPDVLSIDIDGNDYWVWEEIGRTRRPRVVLIEYNPKLPPPVRWVLPYRPDRVWDGTYRQGATIAALVDLANHLGYRLVGCDSFGANAFFVRDDVARLSDDLPAVAPADAFWPAGWNPGHFGHPGVTDWRDGELAGSELDQVLVSDAAVHADLPLHVGQPVPFSLTIDNWGHGAIGGAGAAGTFAVCEWLPGGSGPGDWFRWGGEIHGLIAPGQRRLLIGGCRAPDQAGEYLARVALAQEATGPAPGGAACCEIAVRVEPWPA